MATKPDTAPNAPVVNENDQYVNANAPQAVQPTVAASADNADVVAPTTTVDYEGPAVVDASSDQVKAKQEAEAQEFDPFEDPDARAEREGKEREDAAKRAEESRPVAEAQREEDNAFRVENPDAPVIRAANPAVGGESF